MTTLSTLKRALLAMVLVGLTTIAAASYHLAPQAAEAAAASGIGGYDLASPADQAFAFDYDGSGKLDHLVLYRPGTGTIWILKNNGANNFTPVYSVGDYPVPPTQLTASAVWQTSVSLA